MAAHVGGRASSHRGRGRGGAWEGAVPGGVVVLLLLASAPAPSFPLFTVHFLPPHRNLWFYPFCVDLFIL